MTPVLLTALVAAAAVLLASPASPKLPPATSGETRPGRDRWLPAVVLGAGGAGLAVSGAGTTGTLVVLVVAVLVGARQLWARRRLAQSAQITADQVREACEVMAAELATGLPVATALAAAVPVWPPMAAAATAHRLGGSVGRELRNLSGVPGAGDLVLVAAGWQVAERTGAGLADTLVDVAGELRDQQRCRRVVRAELASARSTARLLAALPVLTLVMASGLGGAPVRFLLGTVPGLTCLGVGLVLTWCGLAWIEAIAAGVERAA